MKIASIYYFNYEGEIGFYDSFRNFCLKDMIYLGIALSTPTRHVYASPTEYRISAERADYIRKYVCEKLPNLKEIARESVSDSGKYFKIYYTDDSVRCFEYDDTFAEIFKGNDRYKISGECKIIMPPFLVFDDVDYGRCVEIVEKFAQLFREKKINQLGVLLEENAIWEEEYSGYKYTSRKEIVKSLRKRCGFMNANLKKTYIFYGLEGVLLQDGTSVIEVNLEVCPRGKEKRQYIFQFDFSREGNIKWIKVKKWGEVRAEKVIFGDALQRVKKGKYNDYENVV